MQPCPAHGASSPRPIHQACTSFGQKATAPDSQAMGGHMQQACHLRQ